MLTRPDTDALCSWHRLNSRCQRSGTADAPGRLPARSSDSPTALPQSRRLSQVDALRRPTLPSRFPQEVGARSAASFQEGQGAKQYVKPNCGLPACLGLRPDQSLAHMKRYSWAESLAHNRRQRTEMSTPSEWARMANGASSERSAGDRKRPFKFRAPAVRTR